MAKLRASREHVAKMLLDHIRVGKDLNAKVKVAEKTGGYRDWLHLLAVWRKDTITDLKAAYEQEDIAFEFDAVSGTVERSSARYTFEYAKINASYGIRKLEDLVERLPMAIPEPESQADSMLPKELAELPNQKKLKMDLAKILSEQQNVALLFADCDGFKAVNDTVGHQAGDQCLVRAIQTIGAAILGKGTIYRYGGDEFVVILPNFDLEEAATTAERIRRAIERDSPGGDLKVTLSIGVANSQTQNTEDANELIHAADMAMYKAKKTKNSVVISDESNS